MVRVHQMCFWQVVLPCCLRALYWARGLAAGPTRGVIGCCASVLGSSAKLVLPQGETWSSVPLRGLENGFLGIPCRLVRRSTLVWRWGSPSASIARVLFCVLMGVGEQLRGSTNIDETWIWHEAGPLI